MPPYITKDNFFVDFKQALTNDPDVSNILDVVDAKVPILKLKINGYHIDLLFATLDKFPTNLEKALKEDVFFNKLNY